MVSVPLSFRPPDSNEIVSLLIYESPAADGPFTLIDTVNEIGTAPDYISEYTTPNASNIFNWFSIKWENSAGVQTDFSESLQGGTELALHKLVERIKVADPDADERLVIHIAEYVISTILNADNPYDASITLSYRQLEGMTLLSLAQIQLRTLASSSGEIDSWTAGLVSMKSSNTVQSLSSIKELMMEAGRILGIRYSVVAQMVVPEIAGGLSEIVSADISRLMIEVE